MNRESIKFLNYFTQDYNLTRFESTIKSTVENKYGIDDEIIPHFVRLVKTLWDRVRALSRNVPGSVSPVSDNLLIEHLNDLREFCSSYIPTFKQLKNSNKGAIPYSFGEIYDFYSYVRHNVNEAITLFEEEKDINIKKTKGYTIAIVTSTPAELNAVRSTLSDELRLEPEDDENIYFTGFYKNDLKSLSVIVTKSPYMGMPAAATTTSKVIMKFRPAYVVMLGITAGLKSAGVKIGDILISEQTLDYNQVVEIQKITEEEEKETIYKDMKLSYNLDGYLKSKLEAFSKIEGQLSDIKSSFLYSNLFDTDLRVKIGKIATGSSLLRSEGRMEQIKNDNQGLIGIDMESYAVFYAVNNTSRIIKPKVVSIKSVSDYGDSTKHDKKHTLEVRQQYAAHTSATFFKKFALDELDDE